MSKNRGLAVASIDLGGGLPPVKITMDRATRYILDIQVERSVDFVQRSWDFDSEDVGSRFRKALDKIR